MCTLTIICIHLLKIFIVAASVLFYSDLKLRDHLLPCELDFDVVVRQSLPSFSIDVSLSLVPLDECLTGGIFYPELLGGLSHAHLVLVDHAHKCSPGDVADGVVGH